ncbi:MAG TPA: hypothetical protein VM260_01850 [Pirellula sp.]|nr:hypothetical protein [Pirellula sp.]
MPPPARVYSLGLLSQLARSSKEYQQLIDRKKEDDIQDHGESYPNEAPSTEAPSTNPTQSEPSRDDLALPGGSENEAEGGAA